jgi:tetratricopeptide (TPR) repeat protein
VSYDAGLAVDPGNAEIINNRSVALLKLGRYAEALQSCERALAVQPGYTDALYNRGNALLALGQFADARVSYQTALTHDADRIDTLNNLGLALAGLGQTGEAMATYDRVLAIDPENLDALCNRAGALCELKRFAEALATCDRVLAEDPAHPDALNTRGVALGKLQQYEEALASYDAALAVAPHRADIYVNRGTALLSLDRSDEALASFDRAIARDPDNVGALLSHAQACIKSQRFDRALASYDRALAINPDEAGALSERGVVLAELGLLDEALDCHERALRVAPYVVAAHINRGNALLKQIRIKEALASYERALALDPTSAEANFNASIARLCMGDFRGGWKQYEHRWEKKEFAADRRSFSQPLWRGEKDLQGKTVFLYAEQGLGDTIQFVRYAPMVAALGAKVMLAVAPSLKELMLSLPGVSAVLSDGERLPNFDLHCPLLSLPAAFETELATIPCTIPYLRPFEDRLAKWREQLPQKGRLRVGVCWTGNPKHLNDRHRSLPLESFASLLSVPGLDFISLQKEIGAAEKPILYDRNVLEVGSSFRDFADTAAVVAMLDIVISVDTSVAHLAGAMGKAVALLLPFSPDWRWMLHRADSPWYPTMRLYRQTALGDWNEPLERLRRELADVAQRPLTARRREEAGAATDSSGTTHLG